MKKILLLCFPCLIGCGYVSPGHVGVKVNLYGQNKGVQDLTMVTGRVWYNPLTTEVHEFPTFMQNITWSKTNEDGDESISFNSKEGASLNADVGLSYSIKAEGVPHVFNELRQDADYITKTYMRTKVRDVINRHSVNFTAIEIFGEGKNKLLTKVREDLESSLGDRFTFDVITFVGQVRGDASVEQSIMRTIQATQLAIEAENKVQQIVAEAEQKIAESKGRAQSILAIATAEAEANKILTESLSETLMQYKAVEKWDGIMPKVTGGALPFINLDLKKE